jgi:excisionase family DNA binding protein
VTAAEQLLTIPQVAARLGVGRSTAYRYVAAGLLELVDLGTGIATKTRVAELELARFIEARKRAGRNAAA